MVSADQDPASWAEELNLSEYQGGNKAHENASNDDWVSLDIEELLEGWQDGSVDEKIPKDESCEETEGYSRKTTIQFADTIATIIAGDTTLQDDCGSLCEASQESDLSEDAKIKRQLAWTFGGWGYLLYWDLCFKRLQVPLVEAKTTGEIMLLLMGEIMLPMQQIRFPMQTI